MPAATSVAPAAPSAVGGTAGTSVRSQCEPDPQPGQARERDGHEDRGPEIARCGDRDWDQDGSAGTPRSADRPRTVVRRGRGTPPPPGARRHATKTAQARKTMRAAAAEVARAEEDARQHGDHRPVQPITQPRTRSGRDGGIRRERRQTGGSCSPRPRIHAIGGPRALHPREMLELPRSVSPNGSAR